MQEQEMTIVTTNTRNIDLESMKQLATNPKANAEIHGNGDIYICYSEEDHELVW